MTTCFIKYIIDPTKIEEFEHYGKLWIDLVNNMGGLHHGYLLPHEGANNVGYASFSFRSLAEYEIYRNEIGNSPKCLEALKYATDTKCIISYERNFLKPVFEGIKDKAKLVGLEVTEALPIFVETDPENCDNPEELENKASFSLDEIAMVGSSEPSKMPKEINNVYNEKTIIQS